MPTISRLVAALLLATALPILPVYASDDPAGRAAGNPASIALERRPVTEAGLSLGLALDRVRRSPVYQLGELTPNQLTDGATLTPAEAEAACGPAAAVALARAIGVGPTLDEAVALARRVGWTAADGMTGLRGQVHLLAHLGVAARAVGGGGQIDWQAVARDVQRGDPVIVVTTGHYYVAERYDPESGRFDLATSAMVLRAARGQRWYAPHEIAALGTGPPRAVIHLVRPGQPPSVPVAVAADEAGRPTTGDGVI